MRTPVQIFHKTLIKCIPGLVRGSREVLGRVLMDCLSYWGPLHDFSGTPDWSKITFLKQKFSVSVLFTHGKVLVAGQVALWCPKCHAESHLLPNDRMRQWSCCCHRRVWMMTHWTEIRRIIISVDSIPMVVYLPVLKFFETWSLEQWINMIE